MLGLEFILDLESLLVTVFELLGKLIYLFPTVDS